MATSGQTLNDRINAARYALAGQGIARCVCKATTEEVIGPKKKHLDYIIACTHEPNVSIPQLANLLIERTNHISWVVVFKALVTVHHLMCYGNERFIQYLASSNYSFELSTFLDKTGTRDYSMSNFIRRYSRYINEKALSYRVLAFDLCKVKRGNDGVLRSMPVDRLLKTLPVLQNQLDALLEFDCMANDLNNGVINACFMLLFRDLIGLFACHNDGIINLLKEYFKLNRKMCREAFDLYKKFLVRIDKVSEFLRVAEAVGIDKDEIPDLKRAPNSLLEALENHLQLLESSKKMTKHQSGSAKLSSDINAMASFGTVSDSSNLKSTNSGDEFSLNCIKDEEVRRAVEEEARVLSQYGTETKSKASIPTTNDLSKFATIPKTIDDIFGDVDTFGTFSNESQSQKNSNGLSFDNVRNNTDNRASKKKNDSIKSSIQLATNTLEGNVAQPVRSKKASDDLFGLLDNPAPLTQSNNTKDITPILSNVSPFDIMNNKKDDTFGSITKPQTTFKAGNPFPEACSGFSAIPFSSSQNTQNFIGSSGFDDLKDVLQPIPSMPASTNGNYKNNKQSGPALFTGDLESTLANLADNLISLDSGNKNKK